MRAAHSAQAEESVSTTLLPPKPPMWLPARTTQPMMAHRMTSQQIVKDWDTEANAKEGLFPDKLRLRSHTRVHWVCHKCPLGLTRKYVTTLASRTLAGSGCSCCGGRTVCKCNSLPSLHPGLVQEWDYVKNDRKPSEYTARSHAVIWWKSRDQRSWQQSINTRTDKRLKRQRDQAA